MRALSQIALVALLGAVGCGDRALVRERVSSGGGAVTNGTDDDGDGAVVALVDVNGRVVCTGTLIAPHVVLTAAHCGIGSRTYRSYRAYFGAAAGSPGGSTVRLGDAIAHPSFDANTFANDVALIALAEPAPAAPIAVIRTALDASLVGYPVRVVGFGATSGVGAGIGRKRMGSAKLSALATATFDLTASPSQPCAGDSGGPALLTIEGVEYVAGVTSHGDGACVDHATETRVDVQRDAFLTPYLAAASDGAARVGDRCFYSGHCAPGSSCVAAPDEATVTYCSRACVRDGDCPAGMPCADGSCRYPLPTPGAVGARCATDGDCILGECIAGGVCSRRCAAKADCPARFVCADVGSITLYCVAEPQEVLTVHGSTACGMAPNPGPGASSVWLLAPVAAAAACLRFARRRARRAIST